jgi:uncharacterized Fe-S cluster protein YjdI
MARKTYRGQHVNVSFDLEVCTHAGECVRSLPKVFDTERRPWIAPDEGSADEIRDVVTRCPSGALEIVGQETSGEPVAAAATIQVMPGGPLLISGSVALVGEDGATLETGRKVALCRCGRTNRTPYCDGSHAHD